MQTVQTLIELSSSNLTKALPALPVLDIGLLHMLVPSQRGRYVLHHKNAGACQYMQHMLIP